MSDEKNKPDNQTQEEGSKIEVKVEGAPFNARVGTYDGLLAFAKEENLAYINPLSMMVYLFAGSGNYRAMLLSLLDLNKRGPKDVVGAVKDRAMGEGMKAGEQKEFRLDQCYFIVMTPELMQAATELMEVWAMRGVKA